MIFVLAADSTSNIIQDIMSGVVHISVRLLSDQEIRSQLENICRRERVEFSERQLDAISKDARGSLRAGINSLQVAASPQMQTNRPAEAAERHEAKAIVARTVSSPPRQTQEKAKPTPDAISETRIPQDFVAVETLHPRAIRATLRRVKGGRTRVILALGSQELSMTSNLVEVRHGIHMRGVVVKGKFKISALNYAREVITMELADERSGNLRKGDVLKVRLEDGTSKLIRVA